MSDDDGDDDAHLSIGEVLALLKDDFPDITISKIRFLESQGLLQPERTPSGYRKFYDDDIARLEWILRQQRENFLPLKVIKGRLEDGGGQTGAPDGDDAGDDVGNDVGIEVATPEPADTPVDRAPAEPAGVSSVAELQAPRGEPSLFADRPRSNDLAAAVSMTIEELVTASGLDREAIEELQRYGLLEARVAGSATVYDEESLAVARLARRLIDQGMEPRHLRMYVIAVQREAGIYEQLIVPRVRTGVDGRGDAAARLDQFIEIGAQLRAVMLKKSLRGYLG